MLDGLNQFFSTSGFMPHGHCFLWTPALLWSYVLSDALIALSYYSIPFALWYFVRKRPDLPFRSIFVMFGIFVMACGTTHLLAIWGIWQPNYWADAGMKAVTAAASVMTAILLWPLIPRALAIPNQQQLAQTNQALQQEVERRMRAELELRQLNMKLEQNVALRTAEIEAANSVLRATTARYRAMTESASDAVVTANAEGLIEGWNSQATHIFGYTEAEALGQPLTLLIPQRYQDPHLCGVRRVLAGEEPHLLGKTIKVQGLTKSGVEAPLELSLSDWETSEGRFFTGIIRDITKREKAEKELRESEERFRGLVEQSITGIYIIQDGKFAYVNPRFAEILGYSSEDELIDRDPLLLVAEKDYNAIAENNRRLLAGKTRSILHNFTALRKDGSSVEAGIHGACATYCGRPAVIGLLQDISDKKRAEEQSQRYVAQLEKAFMSTVGVATTLSEMRDPYTAGHERRVAGIAIAIGAEFEFDARRLEGLRVAGYLHDIGKIMIPSEILSKPGKLNPLEFELIKEHPRASYDVLKDVEFPWPVAEIVLQHHERIDGSGYPQGLKGEAILLDARILAVADVVEAMASHRPYRPGLGIEQALAEIKRGRGTLYDANVADACLRMFRENRYSLPASG